MANEWRPAMHVDCVECPDCAFTFDARHTDEGGGYSCPSCAERRHGWQPIETAPEGRRGLLTNNLKATDAHGIMSHVWIGFPIRSKEEIDRGWVTFHGGHKVLGLTHWMPLPTATPSEAADEVAGEPEREEG